MVIVETMQGEGASSCRISRCGATKGLCDRPLEIFAASSGWRLLLTIMRQLYGGKAKLVRKKGFLRGNAP